ncbi:hypothetical protein AA0111_g3183 [Alternaria arborescens]|uniref:hypothetical protein n=1 Tax=Alternaria arborescens TaxID=156630 RepID=UPI00107500BA|nr:hypothetical protein AA0111_g3183 [Alternaria arborescens]RYO36253.1 hypothetical protein AA0111_g3183 [Alternaria arborescens]
MKVGEFQKEANITPDAYSRFMSQHEKDKGSKSSVYLVAWAFFKTREIQGIKTTPNKKARSSQGPAQKDSVPSIDDIELDGEKDDKVPLFDTCDDVRKKINAHLKKPGVTQAAFLRAASTSFHNPPKTLNARELSAFRSKKGALNGNTSGVFYGAYVYFEKLRIEEGKPKSKKRQEMGEIHAKDGGLDTKRMQDRLLTLAGDHWHHDAYGRTILNGEVLL